MKSIYRKSLLVGLLLTFACLNLNIANAEPVVDVLINGPSENRVDVLYLGDGYTASELDKFESDVKNASEHFFGLEPYTDYASYFNVRRINVTSNESGADHPEINEYKDTALDATYNCFSIQRLICVDRVKVNQVISNSEVAADESDITIVIVNDPQYGGSGGAIAVASTNESAGDIVLHEVGHSFGLLADEYTAGTCSTTVEPPQLNVTMQTDRNTIKWNQGGGPPGGWIDQSTLLPTSDTVPAQPGLYIGAKYCEQNVYRPTYNSMMRSLGQAFEQVNEELLVRRTYSFVSPLDSFTPASASISLSSGASETFTVSITNTVSGTVSVAWLLDGVNVGSGTSYTLNAATAGTGEHTLEAQISDTTSKVRHDPNQLLKDSTSWTVTIEGDVPGIATLISPTATGISNPEYIWNSVDGATWYLLWLDDSTGTAIRKWYRAAEAGCVASGSVCSVTGPSPVAGNVNWWIRAWNSNGTGPWSSKLSFVVGGGIPGQPTLIAPSGVGVGATPTYSWSAVSGVATWYYLWVNDITGTPIKKWYKVGDADISCDATTCTVTPTTTISGNASWWVMGWNSISGGPWSNAMSFTP